MTKLVLSEKKLTAACAATALIGIASIFIISLLAEPLRLSPGEAARGSTGSSASQKAKISGFVDSVDIKESHAVIGIAALEAVEAISFDTSYVKRLGLERFQEVEALGELRRYKGRESFVIAKIKLLNRNTSFCQSGD
ncbi:hypothetical protein HYU17_01825 [Candidatus Woesearchaeota archaeon]|nr:hypothetical protein [Candidatus Woesearchaeota archaeon]